MSASRRFCALGALKHLWERLDRVCETARLFQVETEIDWVRRFAEAAETRRRACSHWAFCWHRIRSGVALPAQVAERAAADSQARELATAVRPRFENRAPIPVPALEVTRLSVRMFERTGSRLRYVFGSLCGPSQSE